MIVLASCQDVAEQTTQIEPRAVEPEYPSLHTVPPRPQLSYTVEQRRAIVDGLIADRANARYSSQVVRYRAGLSSLPPPAPPALAAGPLETEPETSDAAAATTPAENARGLPPVPETEFRNEDDDLDSFMEEMVQDRNGSPGPADGLPGGEPEANAAPLGTKVIRASATRPVARAAAYPARSPVVILAMPPKTASLPVPASADEALAGRAPAVVWGMPDMTPPAAGPNPTASATALRQPRHALRPPAAPAETSLAGRAPGVVWGMPDMVAAQVEPIPAAPDTPVKSGAKAALPVPPPIETSLAGRAPGVVWGMPDMPLASAGQSLPAAPGEFADSTTTARAAPLPPPARPGTAPAEIIMAGAAPAAAPPGHEPRRAAPPAPAPAKPAPPAPANTVLAGPERLAPTRTASAARPAEAGARSVHATAAASPAAAEPALDLDGATVISASAARPTPQPSPMPVPDAAGLEVAGGLVGIDAASPGSSGAALLSVPFDPRSAMLTPDAAARLGQLLAEARAREARIKIVGEAAAPALALDRALAVGLALVQGGVPADRLELTLAESGSDDRARLFLAAPEL